MAPALQATTRDSSFASTRWTVVRQAADSQTESSHALSALSELCQIYWRPVYVFLRRQEIPEHDAQDLTRRKYQRQSGISNALRTTRSTKRLRSLLVIEQVERLRDL